MSAWREVFRDRWVLVVDKPSGLPTQPDRRGDDDLFTLVRRQHPRAALHHRLDRPASGLVVFALDPRANQGLAAAFREHRVHRGYRAVLAGDALDGHATWQGRLDGRPARTDVNVLARASGMLAVGCALHTGRTHQIRRHAALAGVPIVGDRRYGGAAAGWWPRLALHAHTLWFRHPVTGAALGFVSPLPEDLEALWRQAGGPAGGALPTPAGGALEDADRER